MKLALGPVPYYWTAERFKAFYDTIADTDVDIVYLGEQVCSRRHNLRLPDWLSLAERLTDAGKEVVLSSLILVESESDLKALRRLAANGRFRVEANDMAMVQLVAGHAEFVIGPHLNVYNAASLGLLIEAGAVRWCAPTELSAQTLAGILSTLPATVESEVVVLGPLTLALSARCFTARHYNRQKDDCDFICMDHPTGMPLTTQDGQDFLVLNGVQTLSAKIHSLLHDLGSLRRLGVAVGRVVPLGENMAPLLAHVRARLDGRIDDDTGQHELAGLVAGECCGGYWNGLAGMQAGVSAMPGTP